MPAKECREHLEAEEGKGTDTLILAQRDSYQTSKLQDNECMLL